MAYAQPPTQITQPETFILESLSSNDESDQRLDGRILYDVLRLQGKNPIYYYFRTLTELDRFSDVFRQSGYRYLHLSCHGNNNALDFTFAQTDYEGFADVFNMKLNNRRLFISACNLGNKQFADVVFAKNGGMYSITAPTKNVLFSQSASFWSAFYYMMHAWDSTAMKKDRLTDVLERLTEIFEMPLAHYFKNTGKGGAVDELLFAATQIEQAIAPSKSPLPGEVIN